MSKYATLAILFLSLGVFALPASAGDRHDRRASKGRAYDSHREFDAHDSGHRRGNRIKGLAYELEHASGDLLERLRRSCGDDYAARKAVFTFEKLHDRTRHYLRSIDRRGPRSQHAQRDFRRLKKAFRKAQHRLHDLEPRRGARRNFAHVRSLIHEIGDRYAYASHRPARDQYAHQALPWFVRR